MQFQVREATSDDIPGVVETVRAVYVEYGFTWEAEGYHADLYHLDRFYQAHGHRFLVASGPDGVVGTCALLRFPALPGSVGELVTVDGKWRVGGCDCALNRLYVHPSARRLGVGGALTQAVIDAARADGRRAMEIWSDKLFGDAHRLYGRFGATLVGDRILDDPDQSPEWGLVLRLT